MKKKIKADGVGYFDSFFSALDMSTIASSLKQFLLEEHITEDREPEEILNQFISTIIKNIDLEDFKKLAPQLFTYPKSYSGIIEVDKISATTEQLNYLKANIDSLLQIKSIATQ